jgi:hypothetical protein
MVIIATTLLVAYTLIICVVNKRIPDSLSQSVFYMPPTASWLWTLVIGIFAYTIMPNIIDKAPENWQWIAFLSCGGLMAVAFAPLLPAKESLTQDVIDKSDLGYKVHMVGAFTAAIGSQVLMAICQWLVLLCWIPFVAYLVYHLFSFKSQWRTMVFWAEMTCFMTPIIYISI